MQSLAIDTGRNRHRIAKRLSCLSETYRREKALFPGPKEADAFVRSNPFAFLVGVILNQGIPAERAWSAPLALHKRLGHLDPKRIAAMSASAVEQKIQIKPRFPSKSARWVVSAAKMVNQRYGGEAVRIWNDRPTANELHKRFDEFPGIDQKKAAMATNILRRKLGIPVADREGIDVADDVHIRRVFLRTGLIDRPTREDVVRTARELNPKYPGALDLAAWYIGRDYCHPRSPACTSCPLDRLCPKIGLSRQISHRL